VPSNFSRFVDSAGSKGVSSIAQDPSGRLLSWFENGFEMVVIRDGNSRIQQLRATSSSVTLVTTFTFDIQGHFQAMAGDLIPSLLTFALLNEAGSYVSSTSTVFPQLGDMVLTQSLQPIRYPVLNIKGTLVSGTTTVVTVLDQNNGVVGTFSLGTVGVTQTSGMLTDFAGQLKYRIDSGSGIVSIIASITS
jgi:hypothetical protein